MEKFRDNAITIIMDFIQGGNCDINFAKEKSVKSDSLDINKFYIVLLSGKFKKYECIERFEKKNGKDVCIERQLYFNFPDLDKYDIFVDKIIDN